MDKNEKKVMKNLTLTLLLLAASVFSNAQEPLSFSRVIQTDSVGKDKLFGVIHAWLAKSYNSANNVLQMIDKENGLLVGKGSQKYFCLGAQYQCFEGYLNYTFSVSIKDNRFKVDISGFTHEVLSSNAPTCQLGLLTTQEIFTDQGFGKSFKNKTWEDLKVKAEMFSRSFFASAMVSTRNLEKAFEESEW